MSALDMQAAIHSGEAYDAAMQAWLDDTPMSWLVRTP